MQQDSLLPQDILRRLPARRRLARCVAITASSPSTNEDARAALVSAGEDAAKYDGMLFSAEVQTRGKGRREREWWSGPACSSVAASLVVVPAPQPVETLGLLGACALAETLRPWVDGSLALKWPNDLLIDGAKVAGLLAEVPPTPAGREPGAVLGLGLNVHAVPPREVAPYPVTSVAEHADRVPSRTVLLTQWILGLERRLAHFLQCGPADMEAEMLGLLRAWAPHGVRPKKGAGAASGSGAAGPLIEFAVSEGLTWGPEDDPETRPLGLVPDLEAIPGPL